MKYLLFPVFSLFFLKNGLAQTGGDFLQRSHVRIAAGVMNYSGFMNPKNLTFDQAKVSVEGAYEYDIVDNLSLRGSVMFGSLGRDNGQVLKNGETNRTGAFRTDIVETDLLPEYNFLSLEKNNYSPYIFAGPGFYRLFHYKKDGVGYGVPNKYGLNLRYGLGFKYQLDTRVQFFIEGSRREFSKSIDFYDSKNSPSRYYSFLLGVTYRLKRLKFKELW